MCNNCKSKQQKQQINDLTDVVILLLDHLEYLPPEVFKMDEAEKAMVEEVLAKSDKFL